MVLNPYLYTVLQARYGDVRVYNENVKRVESYQPGQKPQIIVRGESYNICCPCCDDDRFRLSIGYQWLTKRPMSSKVIVHLANCYRKDCDVREESFWHDIYEEVQMARLGVLDVDTIKLQNVSARTHSRGAISMPKGVVPINGLPLDHRAVEYLFQYYPVFANASCGRKKILDYLYSSYGVVFAEDFDDMAPGAQDRIIFPIVKGGNVVAWQGRAISSAKKPKWFLPPGFDKTFYNCDAVLPTDIPILCEGIVNAIASGPKGIAMFGKQLNSIRAEEFSKSWRSVIIATDPDTFVPDNRKGAGGRVFANELRDVLGKFIKDIRMIRWPQDVLEIAQKNNNGEDVTVPDHADLGFQKMQSLIAEVT